MLSLLQLILKSLCVCVYAHEYTGVGIEDESVSKKYDVDPQQNENSDDITEVRNCDKCEFGSMSNFTLKRHMHMKHVRTSQM